MPASVSVASVSAALPSLPSTPPEKMRTMDGGVPFSNCTPHDVPQSPFRRLRRYEYVAVPSVHSQKDAWKSVPRLSAFAFLTGSETTSTMMPAAWLLSVAIRRELPSAPELLRVPFLICPWRPLVVES